MLIVTKNKSPVTAALDDVINKIVLRQQNLNFRTKNIASLLNNTLAVPFSSKNIDRQVMYTYIIDKHWYTNNSLRVITGIVFN